MKKNKEVEEIPSGLDKFLKRYLILFLGVFYFIFSSFIQPYLNRKFVINHERDCWNVWDDGEPFDLKVQLTNTIEPKSSKNFRLLKILKNISYKPTKPVIGDKILDFNFSLKITDEIRSNKTILFFHILASPSRCNFIDHVPHNGKPCYSIQTFVPVIRWIQKKIDLRRNLLSEKIIEKPTGPLPFEPYVYKNLSFDIVHENRMINPELLFASNGPFYRFSIPSHIFLPPISPDQFWEIEERRTFLNFSLKNQTQNHSQTSPEKEKSNTNSRQTKDQENNLNGNHVKNEGDFNENNEIEFNIQVYLRHPWLWEQKLSYDEESHEYEYVHKVWEDMKRAMIDTKPLLLYTTIFASGAKIILNLLAFKEDVSWWNSRENLNGISIQTLGIKAFSQFVIFLFLLDEDTSWLVRIMKFISVILEFWKISKVLEPIMEFPYFQVKKSYRSSTFEIDAEGSKYLSYLMIPLLIIYSIYSLVYEKFKSLYSFLIRVAVGAVYAFGFLAMLPQLYINYRLKTVAGMSGLVLALKFVNTFIDDLFAFVMTMPTLHRIACFRDDIVFFIWLYQCYIYPTDLTRVNEFGESFVEEDKKDEENEINDKAKLLPKIDDESITHRTKKDKHEKDDVQAKEEIKIKKD
ncbi:cisplatin [Tritrichomonas foetus]|uniref:Cisplatin n=1 Tax=Tritrichomonas foetus TaxID=1144522 RepID=A0A1J4KP53_9EUKA|nr:cisplatin [Tritrichomonas foetus]|eukprot:OHT13071.1 cisplatin [Tritrichomonas foetus]